MAPRRTKDTIGGHSKKDGSGQLLRGAVARVAKAPKTFFDDREEEAPSPSVAIDRVGDESEDESEFKEDGEVKNYVDVKHDGEDPLFAETDADEPTSELSANLPDSGSDAPDGISVCDDSNNAVAGKGEVDETVAGPDNGEEIGGGGGNEEVPIESLIADVYETRDAFQYALMEFYTRIAKDTVNQIRDEAEAEARKKVFDELNYAPKPTPKPTPESAPKFAPKSAPESAPKFAGFFAPESTPKFAPESALESAPESAPKFAPKPTLKFAPKSAPESALESAPKFAPKPTPKFAPKSAPKPTLKFALKSAPKSALKPASESSPEPVPIRKRKRELKSEPETELETPLKTRKKIVPETTQKTASRSPKTLGSSTKKSSKGQITQSETPSKKHVGVRVYPADRTDLLGQLESVLEESANRSAKKARK